MKKHTILVLLLIVGLSLSGCRRLLTGKPHPFAAPIPPVVLADLCVQFEAPPDSKLCNPRRDVYTIDIFRTIVDAFRFGVSTYDDVQAKLGAYQYECGPDQVGRDDTIYYDCTYDLTGDLVYRLSFGFNKEDNTLRVIFPPGGGYQIRPVDSD